MKVLPNSTSAVLCVMLITMLLLGEASLSRAATSCNPVELAPCYSAMTSDSPPSSTCCTKLKEQRPCLCQYMKDPNYQKLIDSPSAKKVSSACQIPFPTC